LGRKKNRTNFYEKTILMFDLFKEFYLYMIARKKYWLTPLILVLLFLGTLMFLTQGTVVAPFIYTIF
jgi:hypothetical protein